jgi:hypothetical protein
MLRINEMDNYDLSGVPEGAPYEVPATSVIVGATRAVDLVVGGLIHGRLSPIPTGDYTVYARLRRGAGDRADDVVVGYYIELAKK